MHTRTSEETFFRPTVPDCDERIEERSEERSEEQSDDLELARIDGRRAGGGAFVNLLIAMQKTLTSFLSSSSLSLPALLTLLLSSLSTSAYFNL